MKIAEVASPELIKALRALDRADWNTSLSDEGRGLVLEIETTPPVNKKKSAIRKLKEIAASSRGDVLYLYSVSEAIYTGLREFIATDEQCKCLENYNASVSFNKYRQPYPVMFIRLPHKYRNELSERFDCEVPVLLMVHLDQRTGFVLISQCWPAMDSGRVSLLATRTESLICDEVKIRVPPVDDERIELVEHLDAFLLNFCMAMCHFGTSARPSDPRLDRMLQEQRVSGTVRQKIKAESRLKRQQLTVDFEQDVTASDFSVFAKTVLKCPTTTSKEPDQRE